MDIQKGYRYTSFIGGLSKPTLKRLIHYIKYVVAERHKLRPFLGAFYYLKQNLGIAKAKVKLLAHYMKYGGMAERRNPNSYRITPVALEVASVLKQTALNKSFIKEACDISFSLQTEPEVSILIPVYNNLSYTLQCLKALTYQDADITFEVILVDDNSTDETEEIVQKIQGIKYIRNHKNLGFLHSCNTASVSASGRFLVLLNNDTVPLSNWLKELIKPFKMDPRVGLVGSMLLYPNCLLQEAGGLIWKDGSGWNYGRGEDPSACEYNFARETDYCSGASIAIPLNLWKQLQGFDPIFEPAYYEDTDLAFRVRKADFKVLYNPFSKVIHFEGVSSGNNLTSGQKQYQLLNQPRFAERWQEKIRHNEPPESFKHYIDKQYNQHLMLWIDMVTPTPDQDSGSGDAINFFNVLKKNKWGISFIPFGDYAHAGRYTEDLQRLGVECLYYPYINSVESYLKVHGSKFDIVVLSRITVAKYLVQIVHKYAPQAKLIFNTVDLHFLRYERELQLFGDANAAAVTKARNSELQVVRNSDITIVISEREAEILRSFEPSAKLHVIPILREIPGRRGTFSERRDICFLGNFTHQPNVDAVKFFTSSIWPLIVDKLPNCRFVIAGSYIPTEIQNLESNSVIVRGFVPALKDLFDNVRISVAPLRYGAGMKGKVVSSLSYGVPVVATTIAAEGMNLSHGKNAVVTDEVGDFAHWLVQVYSSEELWTRISDAGLIFAKSNFSIESISPKIITMLNSLTNSTEQMDVATRSISQALAKK